MIRIHLIILVLSLMCAVGLGWPSTPALAQSSVFVFDDSASTAVLEADVFADDWLVPGSDADVQTTGGFYSPFPFSGGTVDWGNTLNIVAQDGVVTSSANPLVRLDGDGTGRVSIAWKTFNILDCDGTEAYDGTAESETTAQIILILDNLVGDQDYTVYYQWSVEGIADGEHEVPTFQEDPESAEGFLNLDVGGVGPGSVFSEVVDNVDAAVPEWVFSGASEAFTFHTAAGVTSVAVVIDVYALARSRFAEPEANDLVLTIMRGTLTLTVNEPIPGIIVSEVVDGDLPGGTPKHVEITNCGNIDWVFGTDDVLNIYFNGSTAVGTAISLGGIALAAGDSYVIATSRNSGITQYQAAYLGNDADLYVDQDFGNGDDVYSLELGTVVHDTYGWIGVDGTGQSWEYTNSYAYSKPYRAPNAGVFDPDSWIFGGVDALAAASDPERHALLRARTTPGRHVCAGIVGVACDSDNDGDADLNDFAAFTQCMFGPGVIPSPTPPPTALECLYAFDAEPDSDVDLADSSAFLACFTVP
jgi:hypothetical protein